MNFNDEIAAAGLRPNHHNLQNLLDVLPDGIKKDSLLRALGADGNITTSCFIEAGLRYLYDRTTVHPKNMQ